MKVYVAVKAKPFGEELYVGVAGTYKKAEKLLRNQYPHMRKDAWSTTNCYYADNKKEWLLFIKEEEV